MGRMKSTESAGSGKVTPLRRTQETRSRTTRDKLLQATIDVLMECGYAASPPRRSTQGLASRVALACIIIQRRQTSSSQPPAWHTGARPSSDRPGRRLPGTPRTAPAFRRGLLVGLFRLAISVPRKVVVAARTDKELMARIGPVLEEFHTALRNIWTQAFVDAGYEREEAETVLRMTLNMIRGMALNRIWENDIAEYERLIETWCSWHAPKRMASKRLSM